MILKRWRDVSNIDNHPPPTNNAEPWRDTKHRSGQTLASAPQHQITKPLAGFPPCIYTDSDTLRASKLLRSSIFFFCCIMRGVQASAAAYHPTGVRRCWVFGMSESIWCCGFVLVKADVL